MICIISSVSLPSTGSSAKALSLGVTLAWFANLVQLRHDDGVSGAARQKILAHELVAFAAAAFDLARQQPRPVQRALLLADCERISRACCRSSSGDPPMGRSTK